MATLPSAEEESKAGEASPPVAEEQEDEGAEEDSGEPEKFVIDLDLIKWLKEETEAEVRRLSV